MFRFNQEPDAFVTRSMSEKIGLLEGANVFQRRCLELGSCEHGDLASWEGEGKHPDNFVDILNGLKSFFEAFFADRILMDGYQHVC